MGAEAGGRAGEALWRAEERVALLTEVAGLRAVLAEQHQANAALTIVNTRLEAEVARLRDELAAIAAHNPYPAEVFTPLTAEEQGLISAALRDSGVRNPLDRTYADWGRHIGWQYADTARRALAGDDDPAR